MGGVHVHTLHACGVRRKVYQSPAPVTTRGTGHGQRVSVTARTESETLRERVFDKSHAVAMWICS